MSGLFGRHFRWSLVLGVLFFPAPVFALLISMSFESVPGSVPLTGAGTTNATLNFGNVSAFVFAIIRSRYSANRRAASARGPKPPISVTNRRS